VPKLNAFYRNGTTVLENISAEMESLTFEPLFRRDDFLVDELLVFKSLVR
jgi:hypothetical protein